MTTAIIPARSGSKRIPMKNIRPIAGIPALCHAIRILKSSDLFDQIVVSTDYPLIQSIANKEGAITPFIRPQNLSDDFATTKSVITHAIDQLMLDLDESICCFYPTSVLTRPTHLIESKSLSLKNLSSFVFSAKHYPHPIERAIRLNEFDIFVEMLAMDSAERRTQDFENRVHDAGQFYWGTARAWKSDRPILDVGSQAYLLGQTEAVDVDTLEDWNLLEALFQNKELQDGK